MILVSKLETDCSDLKSSGSVFYPDDVAEAKPLLPAAFLGLTEDTLYFHRSDCLSFIGR